MRIGEELISESVMAEALKAEGTHTRGLMPQPILLPALLGYANELAAWALGQVRSDFDPEPEQVVPVRKTRHAVRPVAELYLRDQLAYRALVAQMAGYLPAFSRSATAHEEFERAPLSDGTPGYVLSSDVAAFYQYVDYDLLARELVAQTGDGGRVDALLAVLTVVTGRRFGLPQQNTASDVVAEAYIDVLERRLHRADVRVWRYNDDFRIVTDSWSQALAAVDRLENEARRIGLTLNDSKTVIRRGETYESSLKACDELLKEVGDEAELDLTAVHLGRGYDPDEVDLEQDDVATTALMKLLDRWAEHEDDARRSSILTQLMPFTLSHLPADVEGPTVLAACMKMLRTEQQALTPAVTGYLLRATDRDEGNVLTAFDDLLALNPYLTPWQAAWVTPALSRCEGFASGPGRAGAGGLAAQHLGGRPRRGADARSGLLGLGTAQGGLGRRAAGCVRDVQPDEPSRAGRGHWSDRGACQQREGAVGEGQSPAQLVDVRLR